MYQTFHWDVCELAKTIVGMCFAGEVVLIACCCSFATVLSWMNTDTLTHMHGVWKMASSILWMGFGVCPNDGIRKDCQEQHGVWSWDWHSRMRSVCTVWVRQHRKQFQNVPSGHGKNWEEKLSMEKLGRVVRYSDRAKKSNDSSLSNDFPRSLDRHKWTSPKRWLIGSAWGIKIHVNQMYHDVQEVTYRGGEDTFQTPTLPPPPPPNTHTHTPSLPVFPSVFLHIVTGKQAGMTSALWGLLAYLICISVGSNALPVGLYNISEKVTVAKSWFSHFSVTFKMP